MLGDYLGRKHFVYRDSGMRRLDTVWLCDTGTDVHVMPPYVLTQMDEPDF